MRYSDRAILKLVDKNEYGYEIGEHVYKELYSDMVACFTMDLGLGKSVQIFGDYNKQRKVIFLKNAIFVTETGGNQAIGRELL